MEITASSTARFVTTMGLRLRVHEFGSGPLLLLVHGGGPGATGWGNFGQNVAGLGRYFRTVVVDLPGYGESDSPPADSGPFSFPADVLADLIPALGEERAHVVGLATGGAVGIMLAGKYPQVVDRLVLVNSAGGVPVFSVMPSEGVKHIRDYYRNDGPTRNKMRAYLECAIHDHGLITDELVEERYLASVHNRAREGSGAAESVVEWLPRIAAKTLLVWGRDNRVQGYDMAIVMLNRIPDVEMHLFGAAGLWVPWERRERFESIVVDFLTGPGS